MPFDTTEMNNTLNFINKYNFDLYKIIFIS